MILEPRISTRTATSLLLGLLLVVQGMMPGGYMPASVESGWLVMLCPEGLPRGFLAPSAHDHHAVHGAGHEESAGAGGSGTYCPLGHAVGAPAITELAAVVAGLPVLAGRYEAQRPELILAAARHPTQPRAPPIS